MRKCVYYLPPHRPRGNWAIRDLDRRARLRSPANQKSVEFPLTKRSAMNVRAQIQSVKDQACLLTGKRTSDSLIKYNSYSTLDTFHWIQNSVRVFNKDDTY